MTTETNHARENARAYLDSMREIFEGIDALLNGEVESVVVDGETFEDVDALRDRIRDTPLSVLVRFPWIVPGTEHDMLKAGADEYEILLTTGGPALRIRGDLNEYGEPTHAYMQYQDWGTPWTDFFEADYKADAAETLLRFALEFYYGE